MQSSKLHSTGKGALGQTQVCQEPCGTCQTGAPVFHPADTRVLARAREKKKHKPSEVAVKPTVEKVGQVELARTANHLAAGAVGQGAAGEMKVNPGPAGRPAKLLAAKLHLIVEGNEYDGFSEML